jgi:hypothetical protein
MRPNSTEQVVGSSALFPIQLDRIAASGGLFASLGDALRKQEAAH